MLLEEHCISDALRFCPDNVHTVTVPNTDATNAHQILFITLVVDNTKAISASDIANCKVEIL